MINNNACACVQLFIEGGGDGTNISSPYNKILPSLPPLPYLIYNTFTHLLITVSLYSLHTFTNSNATLSPCTIFHIPPATPAPTILLTSSTSTHRSLSNSPHVTNKCSTSLHSLTLHTSHLESFHTSSYPPTTQLNRSLTNSLPCTDFKYFSTTHCQHIPLRCTLAAYLLRPVLLISHLNLFLPAKH